MEPSKGPGIGTGEGINDGAGTDEGPIVGTSDGPGLAQGTGRQYQRRIGIGRGASGLRGAAQRAERQHVRMGRRGAGQRPGRQGQTMRIDNGAGAVRGDGHRDGQRPGDSQRDSWMNPDEEVGGQCGDGRATGRWDNHIALSRPRNQGVGTGDGADGTCTQDGGEPVGGPGARTGRRESTTARGTDWGKGIGDGRPAPVLCRGNRGRTRTRGSPDGAVAGRATGVSGTGARPRAGLTTGRRGPATART